MGKGFTLFRKGRSLLALLREYVVECRKRRREQGWVSVRTYTRAMLNNLYVITRNAFPSQRRQCPCCGWEGYEFLALAWGDHVAWRCTCPRCGCHERHRVLYLYLDRSEPAFLRRPGRVLHVGPEPCLADLIDSNPRLRRFAMDFAPHRLRGNGCCSFRGDLTRLPMQDASADVVFCLHVLEHIEDDAQALAEIHRILRSGATAYIIVPIDLQMPDTIDFGGPNPIVHDHYRGYGRDFLDKLHAFETRCEVPSRIFSPEEMARHGLRDVDVVFVCSKQGFRSASNLTMRGPDTESLASHR